MDTLNILEERREKKTGKGSEVFSTMLILSLEHKMLFVLDVRTFTAEF